jgi:DNA polymerase III delta prime subunit
MTNLQNIPWVEKYRPTEFENIVLDPTNKQLFENILTLDYFPNILLYGPPGTGKTTTIINLINSYQKKYHRVNSQQVIHLNASDERGIDTIRNQIHSFAYSNNLFEKGCKFVILDEVDCLTKNAQHALKILLHSCPQTVKICLICNYISKIEHSLVSEFICVRFNQLPPYKIKGFINSIAKNEDINMKNEDIDTLQCIYKSDIRSMVNFMQLNQNLNKNEWKNKMLNDAILNKIHEQIFIANKDCEQVTEYIHDLSIQYNIDKKTIILDYFNMIICSKKITLTLDFIGSIEQLVHNNQLQSFDMLNYFYYNMKQFVNN